ncbi:hypothetical protein [Noviherbaspirillum sp.]|jgi:hypothetical protein|uniref:hypothetical protein n=1 Tax=Noviherbaspirillum sp. TaxID=1926288 RepID=UPI0025ED3368|nr:hypothetical protein [Noviherbaspirillum sp.]
MPSISLNQIAGAINQSIGVPTSATSFVDGVNQTISSIGLSQISNGAQTIAGGIAIASALGILVPEIVITSTVVAAAITGAWIIVRNSKDHQNYAKR